MSGIDGVPTSINGKQLPTPHPNVTEAPPWWLTRPQEIREFLESLEGVEVEVIGQTAGGRDIVAAAWGQREMLEGRTCNVLSSALDGGDTGAFYGQGERERQVILFVGATHGNEFDGTVSALNYLNIIVTGKDLLGREQSEMAAEGRKHRFIVIPLLNVDGRERVAHHVNWINFDVYYFQMISQGLTRDGEIVHWPHSKRHHPMSPGEFAFIGSNRNDAGVNLAYDMAMGPDMQPENAALVRYVRREMPDCVMFSHSNHGSLVVGPSGYVPQHYRQRQGQMAALVGTRCARDGYIKHNIADPLWLGRGVRSYYQTDAIYHACGALPLLVEFPCGSAGRPGTHEELVDIGLAAIDEICVFGNRYPFRPPDPPAED